MKKRWLLLLLIFVSAFVLYGCKIDNGDDKIVPRAVTITGPGVADGAITLELEQEVQLTATVTPDNASQEVTWSSYDPETVSIDDDGKIKGLKPGKVDIYAKASEKATIYAILSVTVEEPPADPEGVRLNGPNKVAVGATAIFQAVVEPAGALQNVLWSVSNESIATINDAGRLTGIEEGTVTVTVKVAVDESILATKEVDVVSDTGGPSEVNITGETEMEVDSTLSLMAAVLPSGFSQNVTWSSLQPTLATVDNEGVVSALQEGTVYIVATSVADPSIQAMHTIRVKAKPAPIPYPDLNNYDIRIYAAPHATHEHNPFDDKYKVDDKSSKQRAWRDIESLMNCTMTVYPYPDDAPWGQPRIDWLNQKATTGEAEMDIFVSTTEWLQQLVDGGAALNVLSYYTTYGRNAMAPGLKGSSTYKGGLYSLIYPPVSGLAVDKGLFYNYGLLQQLDLDSPAKLFNEGNWTFDDFKAYVLEANSRMGDGQTVLSGRPALYYMGMINSSGIPIADIVSGQLNFSNPIARDAATLLRELYNEVGWGTIAWDAGATSFNEADSLFQSGDYWFVKGENRWTEDLWGEGSTKFGYVPYPYANNKTKDDARTVSMGGACYMQAAGRQYPSGVNSEYVFRAFTEMMLKTADYIKEDPTYDVTQKMRQAASNKLDDPDSVEAAIFFTRTKTIFDPLYELGGGALRTTTFSNAVEKVVIDGEDYDTIFDGIYETIAAAMFEVYGPGS